MTQYHCLLCVFHLNWTLPRFLVCAFTTLARNRLCLNVLNTAKSYTNMGVNAQKCHTTLTSSLSDPNIYNSGVFQQQGLVWAYKGPFLATLLPSHETTSHQKICCSDQDKTTLKHTCLLQILSKCSTGTCIHQTWAFFCCICAISGSGKRVNLWGIMSLVRDGMRVYFACVVAKLSLNSSWIAAG